MDGGGKVEDERIEEWKPEEGIKNSEAMTMRNVADKVGQTEIPLLI
jgi:hypothetical protein